jgi:hypothetical protein
MRAHGPQKGGRKVLEVGQGYDHEQVVRKPREAEGRLASSPTEQEVVCEAGISEATYHRWKTPRREGIEHRRPQRGERGEISKLGP